MSTNGAAEPAWSDPAGRAEGHPAPSALEGVRVLDLSDGVAGSFAARLLGDFGATVTKVEPPGIGNRIRSEPPFAPGPDGDDGSSLLFEYLNWNKRGVELDLSDPQAHETLKQLVRSSDIVLESFPPGTLASWGIGPGRIRGWNPRVVLTSLTDFGQTGPRAGWTGSDLVLQAMSGVMTISGRVDREPLKRGLRQSLYTGGLNAAYATLAAYLAADRDGIGDHVDVSLHECLVSELVMNVPYYTFAGAVQGRRAVVQDPFQGEPIPTSDGYLSIQNGGGAPFEELANFFGRPEFAEERFATARGRAANADEIRTILTEYFAGRSAHQVFVQGARRRLLMGVVQGASDLLSCEQLAARGAFTTLMTGGREFRYLARLVEMSATPTAVRMAAPALGQHNADLDHTPTSQARFVDTAETKAEHRRGPRLPLEGVRVLDLSYVFAVPYLAGLLADLGAEVVKVEAPNRLDQSRSLFGPYLDNDPGEDPYNRTGTFYTLNRGKRSLVLDLKSDAGRDVLRRLVAKSDIVLDNFTPRVMRGWSTTFEDLCSINPGIIMLSNTAYGSTGPWSSFPGQGTTLEATMGLTRYSGYADDKPWKIGQSYPDFLACWSGLLAIMAALVHRKRTGEGQWIDLGMYQLGAAVIPEALLQLQADGRELDRTGNQDPTTAPSGLYRALGTDAWLAITVTDDDSWHRLVETVDDDRLRDCRYSACAGRLQHRDEVDAVLSGWVQRHDAEELAALLQDRGVCAGAVADSQTLLLDEHLRARNFFEVVQHHAPVGPRPVIGRPFRLTERRPRIPRGAPTFGDGNRSVLQEFIGMDDAEIDGLYETGVVADRPSVRSVEGRSDFDAMLLQGTLSKVDSDYLARLSPLMQDAAFNSSDGARREPNPPPGSDPDPGWVSVR